VQFEGAEKKAEISIDNSNYCLLSDLPTSFWQQLCAKAGANILSAVENTSCRAYILSESSLFVFSDRFVILTCGETNLASAIKFFLDALPQLAIKTVNFQRKNEYFAAHQPSSFAEDVARLSETIAGQCTVLGDLDAHHSQIFSYRSDATQTTMPSYELLAYHISTEASDFLINDKLTSQAVIDYLGLAHLTAGFTLDSHCFTPYGFSLNAINGDKYVTLHITPQPNNSYVSVVSNTDITELSEALLRVLKPQSFDILTSTPLATLIKTPLLNELYRRINQQSVQLHCGRHIAYLNLKHNTTTKLIASAT